MNFIETLAEKFGRKTQTDRERYRALLRQVIAGTAKDAAHRELQALADSMGLSGEAVLEHAKALEEHDRAEAESSDLENVAEQIEVIGQKTRELEAELKATTDKIRERISAVRAPLAKLENERINKAGMRTRIEHLEALYPDLFAEQAEPALVGSAD